MHFRTTLPLTLLLATSAAAQSTSACAAQPVLDACYASTTALQNGCTSTDYDCLCQKSKAVLVCFNQCPNDSRGSSVASSVQLYCSYASASSSQAAAATGGTVNATESNSSASASSSSASQSASRTGSSSETSSSAAPADQSGAAERVAIGGVLGLVGLGLAVL